MSAATPIKPQLFSGARGKISFTDSSGNTSILAFVTDVSISMNEGLRPTYVVGSINPVTIEPLSVDATASIGRIVPVNSPNGTPLTDVTSLDLGFEEQINTILRRDSVEITIYDTQSAQGDVVIATLKYARFAGKSISTSSGDVTSERYQFVGIYDAGNPADGNTTTNINYGV